MELTSDQLSELESIGIKAAVRAGEMIQSKTKKNHEIVHKKGGNSLASQIVTAIDLESQRLILETLNDTFKSFELGLLTKKALTIPAATNMIIFGVLTLLMGPFPSPKGLLAIRFRLLSSHAMAIR